MRISLTTMMIVALAAPAYAQLAPGGGSPGSGSPAGAKPSITLGGDKKAKTEDDIRYERELDQAYKSGQQDPGSKSQSRPVGKCPWRGRAAV